MSAKDTPIAVKIVRRITRIQTLNRIRQIYRVITTSRRRRYARVWINYARYKLYWRCTEEMIPDGMGHAYYEHHHPIVSFRGRSSPFFERICDFICIWVYAANHHVSVSINNFGRIARRQCLSIYAYVRFCLGGVLSITPQNWDFIAIVVLQVVKNQSAA